MLGILSDIESRKAEAAQAQKLCKLGQLLRTLPAEESDALDHGIVLVRGDALRPQADRFFTVAWLHGVLVDNAYPIGKTVVSEHVRKVCACESGQ